MTRTFRDGTLVGADLIGTDLRDAILDNAVLSWANLYLASITEEEIQQLAARNALVGAMMPDGSRPYPPTWEAQDFLRKHPEDAVAQRKRMLERISSSLRHAQDQALRAYLNRMSELLTDKDRPLRAAPPHDNTREAARAQTLAILPGLDGRHKSSVLLFLRQEGLISAENGPTLSLSGADLRRACLNRAYLQGVNLSETILEGAALEGANLSGVDLSNATLSGANVQHTNLRGADLSNANLRGSYLNSSNLSGSNLRGADLNGADFSDADLSGATGSTDEQLEQQATSLEGATMPNGSKHV